MNATPETFKPGERWLVNTQYARLAEVECLEWSQSGKFVKVRYAERPLALPFWIDYDVELLERLPDVESGNHKTESPRRLETDSLVRFAKLLIVNWPCACGHCKVQKAKAYTRAEEAEKEAYANAETRA